MLWLSERFMRWKHGKGPRNRTCGECANFEEPEPPDAECSEGICKVAPYKENGFWVDGQWSVCGLFKSRFRADQEQAEALGQMRIAWT